MKAPDVMEWSGDPRDGQRMAKFLRQADTLRHRAIWWLEPDFAGSCDLLVTYESATADPLRVRPGDLLRLTDGKFSIAGNRRDRKPRTEEGGS